MKKLFIIAAAAVVAMASCTKTEMVNSTKDGAIDFSVFMHKATKANLTTSANITAFEVTAMYNSATYFDAVAVSKSGSAWTYDPIQYWPATGQVDFFAWAPTATGTGITKSAYNDFVVAPAQDAASQYDFVVARTQGEKEATSGNGAANGVTINFRHAMSQIDVKVFNGNKNLQYDIYGWKVCGVDVDGEYILADASTDGTGKIAAANWTNNTTYNGMFYDDFSKVNKINASANEASTAAANITGATTMILVPQGATTAATKYSAATASATMNGSYIAIDMEIKNATDGTTVAARQWCCWPVAYTWAPGYKYTYIIDLSQGGYKELNDGKTETETGKANDDLDKVLDQAEIVFATVTVDDWADATDTTVAMLP